MRALLALLSFGCFIPLAASARASVAGSETRLVAARTAEEDALERFLARPDEPVTQYRARRSLEGHNGRFKMHGSLEVITEFTAAGEFTYSVVSRTGSDYILEKLLQLLETESRIVESGTPSRSALTADNYELTPGEIAEPGIVKLFAKPRRKELSLIDGAVFITSDDADLVRVEGRMAKNPSFWTSRVYLVRRYERIGGVRVPVQLDSTAQIKIAGESRMSMAYRYEMINGTAMTPQ
jgi:hypothetical protein